MKKNITINLFGALYNIDEDAYELLDQYQTNMRRYFTRREGGEEIADDIEHRVAELFAELKAEGVEAITIEHVQDIIHRIGNPEEMETAGNEADDDTCPPPPPADNDTTGTRKRRKLFRDSEDKMVGGVLSGLCHYFGSIDPLPWRIIFVLLCIFTYSSFALIYLVAWALIPEARTPEERLLMCGKPVNPQTLNEELMRGVNTTKNFINEAADRSNARGCLSTVLNFIVLLFKLFVIFILLILGFAALLFIILMIGLLVTGTSTAVEMGLMDNELSLILSMAPSLRYWWMGACLSGLILVILPLYALLHSLFKRKTEKKTSPFATWMGLLSWIGVLVLFILSLSVCVKIMQATKDKIEWKENTHNGIHLSRSSWDLLREGDWTLSGVKNLNPYLYDNERDFRHGQAESEQEEPWMSCLELKADKEAKGIPEFRLEKSVFVDPGTYRIEALYHMKAGKSSGWFVQRPGDTTETRGNFSTLTPGSKFTDYTWAEAATRPVLSEGADSSAWISVQAKAEEREWHYFAQDVTVTSPGSMKFGFFQDKKFNLGETATKRVELADVRFTRIDTPKWKK